MYKHEFQSNCTSYMQAVLYVECSGLSLLRVELRTLDLENTGSNPGLPCKTLGKWLHSTLLQFTQLYECGYI